MSNVTPMAAAVAAMKPGAAAIVMSNTSHGPPELNCHTLTVAVPARVEATAPQKLNLRQYRARMMVGPNAAPMPPQA